MARARGANAVCALAFESAYGTPPAGGYIKLPFSSHGLGEEQGLIASDLLGNGREMQDPTDDVVNNVGDVGAPVDARNIGWWLRLACGAPSTAGVVSASGSIKFTANPAATSVLTINGTAFTFVAASPTGNQVLVGVDLATTLTNLASALNGSAVSGVAQATYTATSTQLNIVNDTMGTGGNAFTLAQSGTTHATLSGATLAGGRNAHTFVSGGANLPSASIEIANPEVPSYAMNFGAKLDKLKVALSRSGLLTAVCSLIAQGETIDTESNAGDPEDFTTLQTARFAQASGQVKRNGVALGGVVSADFTYSNDLEPVDVIRNDGRIDGADEGQAGVTGNITVRFGDMVLVDQAASRAPCEIAFGWAQDELAMSLDVTVHRVFLPKAKRPVTGPKGVQAVFPWQASSDPTLGRSCTFVLTNDVANYDNPA